MADWTFLIFSGIILILVGIFFILIGTIRSVQENERTPSQRTQEKGVKGVGVILIGPIPIIFGSNGRYAIIVMILAIFFMLLVFLLIK